jgi:hypothetical protein
MALVDLICLANSNKMRGRCIAGLRADGGGWVRPIASDTDLGQLEFNHYRLGDGSEPQLLDLVRLDLNEHRPVAGQPENWSIGASSWTLEARPIGINERRVLDKAVERSPFTWFAAFERCGRGSSAIELVARHRLSSRTALACKAGLSQSPSSARTV